MSAVKTYSNYHPILLVDDESDNLNLTRMALGYVGIHNVETVQDSRQVMPFLEQNLVSVIVLDLLMPHISGTQLLPLIVANYPEVPVIILTASDELGDAVDCLKAGAFDYMVKPVEPNHLISSIDKALKLNVLKEEVSSLKRYLLGDSLEHAGAFSDILTRSKKMRAVFQYAEVAAKSPMPILVTGETGVGKELMARAIHTLSGAKGEFVSVNAAGLDDHMFSDTLFGHRKGAFTGADQHREGLIARAAHGTLFLDEIGELSPASQVKLLRLLQEMEYYQLGSDAVLPSEARIIVATNEDLQKMYEQGKFRKDLYFRLCTHQIHIPPLRERLEDLPLLIAHFIDETAGTLGKLAPEPEPAVQAALRSHPFPGNVRELKAMVTDAVVRHQSGALGISHFAGITMQNKEAFSQAVNGNGNKSTCLIASFGKFPTLLEVEEYMIDCAIEAAQGNKSLAATMLGITRQTLKNRLKDREKA